MQGYDRVLLVGWDGAEPNIVSRMLSNGNLPNLASLVSGGFFGSVRSTIRPESSVAWTTLATGVNPGVHGVFGFARIVTGSYQTRLINSSDVRVPFVWEILSHAGKRVGVLNMPMAYPPRPVNGWLVCGLMTPSSQSTFTYPPDLGSYLLKRNYPIDADTMSAVETRASYLDRMEGQVEQRTQAAIDLMKRLDWDFGAVVYTELDRLQHFFWADMDVHHPARPAEPISDAIPRHYVHLDGALGSLMAMCGPRTLIIVVSDHGFGPCARQLYVNNWLLQHGYLRLVPSFKLGFLAHISHLAINLRQRPVVSFLKRRLFGKRPLASGLAQEVFQHQVDWARTRAWYTDAGGIRVNLMGREPGGAVKPGEEYERLVAEIIKGVQDLRDPLTNQAVIVGAFRRTELYEGPATEEAPDIILEPFRYASDARRNCVLSSRLVLPHSRLFSDSSPFSGNHGGNALCAANSLPPFPLSRLEDITRWLLLACGVSEMPTTRLSPQNALFSAEESDLLYKRLQALGYIDHT